MRRKVGISAVKKKAEDANKFSKIGESLEKNKIESVKSTMEAFKKNLQEFAAKHKDKINSDPEFRQQFHMMYVTYKHTYIYLYLNMYNAY